MSASIPNPDIKSLKISREREREREDTNVQTTKKINLHHHVNKKKVTFSLGSSIINVGALRGVLKNNYA